MKKKVLIMWNGKVEFHTPKATSQLLAEELEKAGYAVQLVKGFKALDDPKTLAKMDLVVPQWTAGTLSRDRTKNLCEVIQKGTGIGGVHGGTGDAFRGNTRYEWMIGGHFVGHPHVGDYTVKLTQKKSPITKGMKERFKYHSEQYYMMVDPAIEVLAETIYTSPEGKKVVLPVVWSKIYGKGRVFYSSLGHEVEEFHKYPRVLDMTVRGLKWATKR